MADTVVDFIGPVQMTVDSAQVSTGQGGATVVDMTVAPAGVLLAADNLSDLTDQDAALDNLGGTAVGKDMFTADDAVDAREALDANVVDVVIFGESPSERRIVSPYTGDIISADMVSDGSPAMGDITGTLSIDGVPVTNGVMTIADEAPAGTIGDCEPTAARSVVARESVILCEFASTDSGLTMSVTLRIRRTT